MRYNNVEKSDPVITYQNINPDKPYEHALYIEDEANVVNNDNNFADLGGLNVFIRRVEGSALDISLDCDATTTTTTTSTTTTPATTTTTTPATVRKKLVSIFQFYKV